MASARGNTFVLSPVRGPALGGPRSLTQRTRPAPAVRAQPRHWRTESRLTTSSPTTMSVPSPIVGSTTVAQHISTTATNAGKPRPCMGLSQELHRRHARANPGSVMSGVVRSALLQQRPIGGLAGGFVITVCDAAAWFDPKITEAPRRSMSGARLRGGRRLARSSTLRQQGADRKLHRSGEKD